MQTATVLEEQAKVDNTAYYLNEPEAREPNDETIAAILEGDKLARAYCSRFIENEDASAAR